VRRPDTRDVVADVIIEGGGGELRVSAPRGSVAVAIGDVLVRVEPRVLAVVRERPDSADPSTDPSAGPV